MNNSLPIRTTVWTVVSLTEKREIWTLLTLLLCPLPIQSYEVQCRV